MTVIGSALAVAGVMIIVLGSRWWSWRYSTLMTYGGAALMIIGLSIIVAGQM